jgi:ribonuclease Z
VRHLVPTIGLRMEASNGDRASAYSCDSEPTPSVVRLASGAAVLFHDHRGSPGHSTAAQAGAIRTQAEVGRLMLTTTRPTGSTRSAPVAGPLHLPGEVGLAKDFQEFAL